jgi:hypothetical protein
LKLFVGTYITFLKGYDAGSVKLQKFNESGLCKKNCDAFQREAVHQIHQTTRIDYFEKQKLL